MVVRDQHFLVEATIVGNDDAHAATLVEAPDQTRPAPLQHFGNGRFTATTTVDTGDADQHAVTMHHRTHFVGRDEQIITTVVGFQETKTIRIGNDTAGNQVELLGDAISATPVHQQLAITHHRGQPARQCVQAFLVTIGQLHGNPFDRHQLGRLAQEFDQPLARQDRIVITLLLTLRLRVSILLPPHAPCFGGSDGSREACCPCGSDGSRDALRSRGGARRRDALCPCGPTRSRKPLPHRPRSLRTLRR